MADTKVRNAALSVCAYVWAMLGLQILVFWFVGVLAAGVHVFVNDVEYCVVFGHSDPSPCRPGHHDESAVEK